MAHGWTSFYSLIGNAAAGLIGLMFIVVTLTNSRGRPSTLRAIALYLTPTILHFGAALAVSAAIEIPTITSPEVAAAIALVALAGLACCLRSAIGIVRVVNQPPHWSDFWLYACAPAALYAGLIVAAIGVWQAAGWATMLTALTLLVLLLLAVRNAWDTITWIAASGGGSGDP
jgi:hypothetical protein